MIKNVKEFIGHLYEKCEEYGYLCEVFEAWYKDLTQSSLESEVERGFSVIYGFLYAVYGAGKITADELNFLFDDASNIRAVRLVSLKRDEIISRIKDETAGQKKEISEIFKIKEKVSEPENKTVETIKDLIEKLEEKNDKYLIFISGFLDTWYDDLGTSLSELNIDCAFSSINAALLTLYGMRVITREERQVLYSEISEVRQNSLGFAYDMAVKSMEGRMDMSDAELELDL